MLKHSSQIEGDRNFVDNKNSQIDTTVEAYSQSVLESMWPVTRSILASGF